LTLLLLGEWKTGLQLYEWRKRRTTEPVGNRQFPQPLLTSMDTIENKVVFVHWEQGLGDTIQFCRYLPLLAARGAKVLFAPQDGLRRLMASLPGNIELVDVEGRRPFDCHAPLLGLPLAFGTDVATIPAAPSYLGAEPDRVERWRAKLGDHGFKIGICWQGKADHHERSFPLACLAGVGRLSGVRLISLHKGAGEVQLSQSTTTRCPRKAVRDEDVEVAIGGSPVMLRDRLNLLDLCTVHEAPSAPAFDGPRFPGPTVP
jgi:hypothetical protein